jgi:hypothetical protein
MKPRIYVETSVISYLAARPSADAVNATRLVPVIATPEEILESLK